MKEYSFKKVKGKMKLDKKTIKDLTSNDEEKIHHSFQCVYHQYYKLVCFCISKYIPNITDIEEIADDTFISFFNHLSNLDSSKNIKYYLLIIAKNKAINFLKTQNKQISVSTDYFNHIPYEMTYQSNDLIQELKKILKDDELNIVLNHLIYGYSFKELAKEMNISLNTIMSKYRRALKKANEHIKRENYE